MMTMMTKRRAHPKCAADGRRMTVTRPALGARCIGAHLTWSRPHSMCIAAHTE
jgi:hypothetical protein